MRILTIGAVMLLLTGCVTGYTLVSPQAVTVAHGTMRVKPSSAWNRAPRSPSDVSSLESWTRNGPLLDGITFIGAIPSGQAITKQKPKDDRKVPVFRAEMTPQDLVSMIESYYRINAGARIFQATSVKPMTFLSSRAVQFDYDYVGSDDIKRRGRSVLAVVDGKLFLVSLYGTASHYFEAALPEFEALIASAMKA